jgi:hypothetical protein
MSDAVADFSGAWAAAKVEINTKTAKSLDVIVVAHEKNKRCGQVHDCIGRRHDDQDASEDVDGLALKWGVILDWSRFSGEGKSLP